ncbi:hypothetical protein [Bacillus altitudinis]|nr:hypothetical protein [Bacillus altitudinis]
MGKKYKESCIEILKEKGPLLGSELRKQLVEVGHSLALILLS